MGQKAPNHSAPIGTHQGVCLCVSGLPPFWKRRTPSRAAELDTEGGKCLDQSDLRLGVPGDRVIVRGAALAGQDFLPVPVLLTLLLLQPLKVLLLFGGRLTEEETGG